MRIIVLVPAKDEAENIARCLASLLTMATEPHEVSLVVIDNGSSDSTVKIARDLGVDVRVHPGIRIGAVRNLAMRVDPAADVYAFVDADCSVTHRWLVDSVSAFSDESIGAIGGYLEVPQDANWVQRAWCLPHRNQTVEVAALASGSLFVRGCALRDLKGFDETVRAGEDSELSERIRAVGMRLLISPSATVIHYGYPITLMEFARRQVWHSSDYLRTRRKRRDFVFIGSNAFLLALGLLVFGALSQSSMSCVVAIGLMLALAFGLTFARQVKSGARIRIRLFVQSLTLNIVYLFARSIGLFYSYVRTIAVRW